MQKKTIHLKIHHLRTIKAIIIVEIVPNVIRIRYNYVETTITEARSK